MSVIAHHVCLSAARRGLRGVYLDSGTNYSSDLARRFLLNWKAPANVSENIAVARPRGLHGLDGIISSIRAMDDIGIIVLDSLTGALNQTVPPASKGRQRFLFTLLESLRGLVNDTGSHVLLTDHSSMDWKREERRPQGGNVLQHGVDSIVHVTSLDVEKNLVSLMIDKTSVIPAPGGAVLKISHDGIKTMKGG